MAIPKEAVQIWLPYPLLAVKRCTGSDGNEYLHAIVTVDVLNKMKLDGVTVYDNWDNVPAGMKRLDGSALHYWAGYSNVDTSLEEDPKEVGGET